MIPTTITDAKIQIIHMWPSVGESSFWDLIVAHHMELCAQGIAREFELIKIRHEFESLHGLVKFVERGIENEN